MAAFIPLQIANRKQLCRINDDDLAYKWVTLASNSNSHFEGYNANRNYPTKERVVASVKKRHYIDAETHTNMCSHDKVRRFKNSTHLFTVVGS